MPYFSIETARSENGTRFHIVRRNKVIASSWDAEHSDVVAQEVARVLNAHADVALIDTALGLTSAADSEVAV